MKIAKVENINGLNPYAQYATNDAINGFFKVLKARLHKNLQERLDLLIQISWQFEGDNTYLSFYYENVFGLYRTFGENLIRCLYDDNEKYDDGNIYDDADFTGLLDLSLYKIIIKWLMSYAEETFTIGWFCGFLQDFCKVSPTEYTIAYSIDKIEVTIPRTARSILLQRAFLQTRIYDCVPLEPVVFNLTT